MRCDEFQASVNGPSSSMAVRHSSQWEDKCRCSKDTSLTYQSHFERSDADEHAPTLGSEGGIWEALGRY